VGVLGVVGIGVGAVLFLRRVPAESGPVMKTAERAVSPVVSEVPVVERSAPTVVPVEVDLGEDSATATPTASAVPAMTASARAPASTARASVPAGPMPVKTAAPAVTGATSTKPGRPKDTIGF